MRENADCYEAAGLLHAAAACRALAERSEKRLALARAGGPESETGRGEGEEAEA